MAQGKRLKQASMLLERVGLQDREYYLPRQLSGGQIQRVAIARALVSNPDVIIADEPTGNLDSASSRLVMELLSEVHQSGHTILLVTHNPELTRYADRVVYMQDGMVVHDEKTTVGEVPTRARKLMYTMPQAKTEEDDLAGVSALMNALPNVDGKRRPTTTKRKKTRKRSSKR
jgi:ABC-type methionine transport system ATPase subunit